MSDYKAEQDWLMRQIEEQQQYLDRQELTETVKGIDRKLRSRIVLVMRTHKTLADLSEKECFDRWQAGYMAQRRGAVEVLEKARTLRELDLSPDLGF
jgi:hypothetical protein